MVNIQDYLDRLVSDAVEIQTAFDRAYRDDCQRILLTIQGLEIIPELLGAALLPPRMVLKFHEITSNVEIEMRQSQKIEIDCRPIPLKYFHLTNQASNVSQRFQISIQQVPIDKNPFNHSSTPKPQ